MNRAGWICSHRKTCEQQFQFNSYEIRSETTIPQEFTIIWVGDFQIESNNGGNPMEKYPSFICVRSHLPSSWLPLETWRNRGRLAEHLRLSHTLLGSICSTDPVLALHYHFFQKKSCYLSRQSEYLNIYTLICMSPGWRKWIWNPSIEFCCCLIRDGLYPEV